MNAVQRWLLCAALALTGAAHATYPEQPIKVMMPFPPGSSVDVVTRLVATEAGALLGKPLVLDYRPGAAGVIATQAVARSPADGYTVLITTPAHTINPALRKDLPFNTEADFAPVSLIATIPSSWSSIPRCRSTPWTNSSSTRREPRQAPLLVGGHGDAPAHGDGGASAARRHQGHPRAVQGRGAWR